MSNTSVFETTPISYYGTLDNRSAIVYHDQGNYVVWIWDPDFSSKTFATSADMVRYLIDNLPIMLAVELADLVVRNEEGPAERTATTPNPWREIATKLLDKV